MAYRVLVVEKDRLMLEQLAQVVSKTNGCELVGRYQTSNDALGQGIMFKPTLILLDTEGQNAVTLIDMFRQVYPQASILCMAETWRAEAVSHLVQAGAKGSIIKPFTSSELWDAIANFSQDGTGGLCNSMTFFSPKGKSGKTTLIANLALALARRTDEQVGIIDADLQFGDLAVFFNLSPQSTIVEAVRDVKFLSPNTLKPYYVPVTKNVMVLCGTRTPNLIDRVPIKGLESIITMSKSLFRYLLIDVPPGFNPTSIAAAEATDTTYLVSMYNEGYEIDHAQRAIEIFKDWGEEACKERLQPIFTRVEPCNAESQQALSEALNYPVTAVVPNAYRIVSAAADNGRMALDIEPDSAITQSVNKLAQQIIRSRKNRGMS